MNISIFGLGYVGAVSLACLARDGHNVIGVDIDPVKLDLIKSGQSPVIEEGMPELMANMAASGRVSVSQDVQHAIDNSEVSFICVGTPSQANGSQDQTAVLRLAEQLGKALAVKTQRHTIVFRSTLLPGTVEGSLKSLLEQHSGKQDGVDFDICFQPEFLREGSSIKDYDNPPFTIVGANNEAAHQQMQRLFGHLPGQYHRTDVKTAETVKYFCNIFHALKITFANEVARLCEGLTVDPFKVMDLVCADKQLNISAAYLKPGFAFGGSCLPKDLRAMQYVAKQADIEIPMLSNVLSSNQVHLQQAYKKILSLGSRDIGMIGLSFKSGTDDLRESPLVDLAEHLIGKGMHLSIFDPEVNLSRLLGANKRFIEESIPHIGELMTSDIDQLLANNKVIVLGLNDKHIVEQVLAGLTPEHILVDLVHLKQITDVRSRYIGLCW
ncbi:nucleotide sugar dehydrogenase [Arsukibacterium indicum]|uniref:UDP-glucose 6-dehydrogenase n=1 Tax=Arsukibacterium indicum TaxID=2848612 RepID=A0ABS6MFV8_9GAMM|nr:nucleotide sugar dehydrogenase [Arsukibacterium indicum]MBV2127698.1 nucleotide sugar dehydrogenase [Arsukibacterium indicum]